MAISRPLKPTSLPGRGVSGDVRMKMPLLHLGLILKSSASVKFSQRLFVHQHVVARMRIEAPRPARASRAAAAPWATSSPWSIVPSKSSCQPSFFSWSVSVLSAATASEENCATQISAIA